MAELKLVVGADVKEAEQALRSLVTNIDKTTAAVQKFSSDISRSFLPVHNINNFRKAFDALKADLSSVKITEIPPIDIDTSPAQLALKSLISDVNKAGGSIDNLSQEVNDSFKGVKIAAIPPIVLNVDSAKQSLRSLVGSIEQTEAAVEQFGAIASNSFRQPLHSIDAITKAFLVLKSDLSKVTFSAIPPVTANIKPAQDSLRILAQEVKTTALSVPTISAAFDRFSKDVNSSVSALSVRSLENFKRSFLDFKNDLSNVKISALPPVTIDITKANQTLQNLSANVDKTFDGIRADITNVKVAALPPVDINVTPAENSLKQLVGTVNQTVASFRSVGSDINKSFSALPFNIEKFRQTFLAFKADLSNVKITPIPPVQIDIRPAQQSLQTLTANVDKTIAVVKSDLSNVKISALPPIAVNIQPARESLRSLVDEAKLTGTAVTGISTSLERFSANVRTALGALPLHNIEAFRQAFLGFKADLSKITIAAIPPIKIDVGSAQQSLQTLSQEAQKTSANVGNVAASFERFSQNIARSFGALPLSSIAAFRTAFLDFKSDLTNVKISTIPPVKVDVSQAQNSLRTLTVEAEKSGTIVNSLSAIYQRWAAQAATSSGVAANALREVNEGVAIIGTTANLTGENIRKFSDGLSNSVGTAPLQNINALRAGIAQLKSDLGSVKITAIPAIDANVRPAQQALRTLTDEAQKSGVEITNVSSAYAKWASKVQGSSAEAANAIKQVDLTVETLRAKIAARKDLIITSKDITQIIKYNKEIEHLEQVLHQVQNAGRTGFFGGKPFDALTKNTNTAHGALTKVRGSSEQATTALTNLGRVAQDAPFGFLGIANNLNPLLESFQRLKATTGTTSGALKALGSSLLGPAGIGVALSVASSLLVVFGDKLFASSKKTSEAEDALKKYKDTVNGIFENTAKEAAQVGSLIALLNSETETRQRKLLAIKELQKIQPEIFAGLKLEGDAVIGLDLAYQNYLKNLKTVIAVKIKQAQLEQKITELLKKQGIAQTSRERKLFDLKKFEEFNDSLANSFIKPEDASAQMFKSLSVNANKASKDLKSDIDGLLKDIGELSKGIQLSETDTKKSGNSLQDFINKAKQLNDELEKIGFIAPVRFSFFDTFEEQLQKARKVFDDFNRRDLKINPRIFTFPSFSEPEIRAKVQEAMSVVEQGIRAGIFQLPTIPLNVDVNANLVTNFSQNTDLIREFSDRFKNLGRLFPDIDMEMASGFNRGLFIDALRKFFKAGTDVSQEEILKFGDQIEVQLKNLASSINNAIQALAVEGFSAVGTAIGTALASGDVSGVFKAFGNVVADAVAAIGKQFISLGVAALLAKKSLAVLFAQPALAIAAGTALIAVAAALRSALNKGITGFAQGGLVFGPTVGLIGEGAGTSRSNPEVVAPLDKLKSLLGGSGIQSLRVEVVGRIRGKDQILQNARTNRSQNRLG